MPNITTNHAITYTNISKIDVVIIALTKVHVDFMDMYM